MKNHEPMGCGELPSMVKTFADSGGALEAAPLMLPASPMVSQTIVAAYCRDLEVEPSFYSQRGCLQGKVKCL